MKHVSVSMQAYAGAKEKCTATIEGSRLSDILTQFYIDLIIFDVHITINLYAVSRCHRVASAC